MTGDWLRIRRGWYMPETRTFIADEDFPWELKPEGEDGDQPH